MGATAEQISILLKMQADLRQLSTAAVEVRRMQDQLARTATASTGLESRLVSLAKRGTAAGLALVGANFTLSSLVTGARNAMALADQLKNLADATAFSVSSLEASSFAARRNGSDVQQLSGAIVNVRRVVQEAAAGNETYRRQLAALGLDYRQLATMAPERMFETVARAISLAVDNGKTFSAILDVLGTKAGPRLQATLRQIGSEGLDSLRKQAEAAGEAMGEKLTVQLEQAKQRLEALDQRWTIFLGKLAGVVLPKTPEQRVDETRETAARELARLNAMRRGTQRFSVAEVATAARAQAAFVDALAAVGRLSEAREAAAQLAEFGVAAKEAQESTIGINVDRSTDWVKRYADWSGNVVTNIDERIKKQAEEKKAQADAVRTQQDQADALQREAAAQEARKKRVETAASFDERWRQTLERVTETVAKSDAEIDQLAETYKRAGDPMREYALKIAQINALQSVNKLTAAEAAAAIKALTAEMNKKTQQDAVRAAVQRSDDALLGFGTSRALTDSSPFLTDREKNASRVDSLRAENAEIERQIANLRKLQDAGGDKDVLGGQIRQLGERSTANTLELGRSVPVDGVGANVGAQLTSFQNELGTVGENGARLFTDPLRAGFASFNDGLAQSLLRAQSWGDAVNNLVDSVATSFVQAGVRMGTEWLMQLALDKARELAIFGAGEAQKTAVQTAAAGTRMGVRQTEAVHDAANTAAQVGTHAAGETTKTGSTLLGSVARGAARVGETIFHGLQVGFRVAAHLAGEVAQTTISLAQKAIRLPIILAESAAYLAKAAIGAMSAMASIPYVGPFLAIGAMAAIIAAGAKLLSGDGFREGGYTGEGGIADVAGVVHRKEFVIPADVTAKIGPGTLYGLMDAVRYDRPLPATLAAGGVRELGGSSSDATAGAGGGGTQLLQPVLVGNMGEAEAIRRGSKAEVQVMRIVQANRYRIFGRNYTG